MNKDQIIEAIENMSVLELADLPRGRQGWEAGRDGQRNGYKVSVHC